MEEPGSQMSITFQAAKVLSPALITTNRSLRYPLTGWGVQIKPYAQYDKSRQNIVCKNLLIMVVSCVPHHLGDMTLISWNVWFHDVEVMAMAVVPAGSYICKARFQAEAHKKQWDGAAKMIHRRRNLTFFEQVFRDISQLIYWFGYWELCLTLCLTFALEQGIWRRSSEGTIFRIQIMLHNEKDNDGP